MKAVILAAGSSSRLYPLTLDLPKCLLNVGGKTLLTHQLEALASCRVQEAVIVVGYLGDMIREATKGFPSTPHLSLIDNPDYASTNNLHSLWLARDRLAGSAFLCLHADVLFHPQILRKCAAATPGICLAVDPVIHEETMKVAISSGRITAIGKEIDPQLVSGTFLGIVKFSATGGEMIFREVETLVKDGRTNLYFTAGIERLIVGGFAVGFSLTNALPWIEIDFPEELERARREVYPAIASQQLEFGIRNSEFGTNPHPNK